LRVLKRERRRGILRARGSYLAIDPIEGSETFDVQFVAAFTAGLFGNRPD